MEDPKDVRIRELEAEVRRLKELVAEYRQQAYRCECCGKTNRAPLPEGVVPSLFGLKLRALTAWMKSKGRLSFQTTRQFLSPMLHINVSTDYIANVVREVSDSLAAPFEDFAAIVHNSARLHCDETGLKKRVKSIRFG